MARNRKSQPAAVRFGPVVKAGVVCAAIVICCVGYVWQKKLINTLAEQKGQRQTRLIELRDQNKKLEKLYASFVRPEYLETRIRELRLGLVQPQPGQIWRLPEPGSELITPVVSSRQFATENTRVRAGQR